MTGVLWGRDRTTQPLIAKRGERWSYTYTVDQPATWTGYTGKAQVRTSAEETAELIAELDVDLSVAGQITVTLASAQTADLDPFNAVWDLYVQAGGERQYVIDTSPVRISSRATIPT